jgi:GT2 family glycosyltransferase
MVSPPSLVISIVTYSPNIRLLRKVIKSLDQAIGYAKQQGVLGQTQLILIDNGPEDIWRAQLQALLTEGATLIDDKELFSEHGNIGYGAGHNLAINNTSSEFCLILNPDVLLAEDALMQAMNFMLVHPQVSLLTPAVVDAKDNQLYLCKSYPSLLDLFLRGFAPPSLKKLFRKRLESYELRDRMGDTVVWDIPIVSGCFMLFRRLMLTQIAGFCPAYFLYFEDFDLSLRIANIARIAYVPNVHITHFGGNAARKGFRHIALFIRSAVIFFNRHGWRLW